MSRSTPREPLFLHVSKRTPVTVHIRPTSTRPVAKKGDAGLGVGVERRSSGRPAVTTSSGSVTRPSRSRSGKMTVSQSSRTLTSKGKSSAQSLHPKMSWEGSTHRLEIHPPRHLRVEGTGGREGEGGREGTREGGRGGGGEGGGKEREEHTTLRMSDLMADKQREEEEGEEGGNATNERTDFESRIQSLQNEVDALTSRLEEEQTHRSVPLTRSRLQAHDVSTPSELGAAGLLGNVASLMNPKLQGQSTHTREELVNKLEEMERESSAICKNMDQLQDSVRKLVKKPSIIPSQVGVQRSKLLQKMSDFKRGSRSLRKLLKEQQSRESCAVTYDPSQSTGVDPSLALHTQGLHDEIGRKEVELQSLMVHTQNLEEQLQTRDREYAELQTTLHECKRRYQQEKEALKRATRQHKHRAVHSQRTTEQLGLQLQEATQELEEARGKLAQLASDKMRQQMELSTLSTRVRDLDHCLTQSKTASESAVDAVSARLTEKTQELNLVQLENDRLRTTLNTIEGALKTMETNSNRKISSMEAELTQTRATSSQYEALSEEYRTQLERCRRECEDLQREVRRKEIDMERLQQDSTAELEKCRMKYDHQLAELEPLPELLKVSELRVQEVQQRLSVSEQRAVEQSRLVDELTAKYDQQSGSLEEARQKWHEAVAENKSLLSRLDTAHRRVEESDRHNRELVTAAARKEENIHRLQSQLGETQETVTSLQSQLHSCTSESHRQQEHIRDKAAGKERAHITRIADLEAQLSKSNSLNSQLRKNKEEAESQHQSRVRSLQEQLDAANASRRSMESYVNFLKASYTSLYSETGKHSAPPFHMLN